MPAELRIMPFQPVPPAPGSASGAAPEPAEKPDTIPHPPVAGGAKAAPAGSLAPAAAAPLVGTRTGAGTKPDAEAGGPAKPAAALFQPFSVPPLARPDKLLAKLLANMSVLDDADFDASSGPEAFRAVDRAVTGLRARVTGGLSMAAMGLAYWDWAMHLAAAPGKQAELALKAWRKMVRFTNYALATSIDRTVPPCISPLKGDNRFRAPAWQDWPYRLWYQGFLLNQQFWHNATHGVPGVSPHHEALVSFMARQVLDMTSPSNSPFTNPEVARRSRETLGLNYVNGLRNAVEDASRKLADRPPVGAENFVPGETVAVTPGEVIYRNHLIELIQYRAKTEGVEAEPVLVVPAWIMKYYILDLSPQNSLINYLVSKGHTVFCISWRNVTAEDRDLGFDDYRRLGLMAALDAINAVVPGRKVHAAGYCLGGTLLSIGAAAMARAGDDRLASVTLFAAQTDFSEAGELQLFVDSSALYMLESMMWDQGCLTARQMAGAFEMLRSNDLVWSRIVHEYLMGERTPMNDLMAWNADATRMPYRMHSEYLRHLFLNNDLAAGRYIVDGVPVSLLNLRVPLFVVGTERDHVAPWKSVYKIHLLTDTDVTFVLASGGHNAGIVSEPGHSRRYFRVHETKLGDLHLGAEEWVEANPAQEGSWWPAWEEWLTAHSSSGSYTLPPIGLPDSPALGPAPGTYVMQR